MMPSMIISKSYACTIRAAVPPVKVVWKFRHRHLSIGIQIQTLPFTQYKPPLGRKTMTQAQSFMFRVKS